MKCPGCGYENLDLFETCKHCGPPLVAGAPRAVDRSERRLAGCASSRCAAATTTAPPFRIDDDLFVGHDSDGTPRAPR